MRRLLSIDPATAAARLAREPGFAWLDGEGAARRGRSYMACRPDALCQARAAPSLGGGADWCDALAAIAWPPRNISAEAATAPEWIGFVAYDAGRDATDMTAYGSGESDFESAKPPAFYFARYPAVLVFDHERGESWVDGESPRATAALRDVALTSAPAPQGYVTSMVAPSCDAHRVAIRAVLEAIREGDVYQVNLARRWRGAVSGSPLPLFFAMRRKSPVPLGAYIDFGDGQILSASMETFLRWDEGGRTVTTRPIKGTVHRSTAAQEQALLRESPKELAEHNMVIDLMRNDLGQIADVGSVRVAGYLSVERYAKLAHLVSTIEAQITKRFSFPDVLRATFPPGSVTGTPKGRAVSLIRALEPAPRGVYCGAVGALYRNGNAHFSVAIRTAQVLGQTWTYHAGGGIVADSNVDEELLETELKASAFLDAVAAVRGLD